MVFDTQYEDDFDPDAGNEVWFSLVVAKDPSLQEGKQGMIAITGVSNTKEAVQKHGTRAEGHPWAYFELSGDTEKFMSEIGVFLMINGIPVDEVGAMIKVVLLELQSMFEEATP